MPQIFRFSQPGLKRYILPLFLGFSVILASCSKYQKVLKSNNYDNKYDLAMKYFEKQDFYKAATLFEELLPIFKGTVKAENVLYHYAKCEYELGEFLMSAYYFENFVKTYPNSQRTEECLYMSADCYFQDSPVYSLDQTNTYKAITQIELFVNRYPKSTRLVDCHAMLDKLRTKLETKSYDIARLYFNMEDYKAAVYEFRNLLKDFPDTRYREYAFFMIEKSWYNYAVNSVPEKKLERFQSGVEAYQSYVDRYPSGEYIKEAQSIFDDMVKQIIKLPKSNS